VRIILVVHRPQSRPDGAALRKANLVRPGLNQRFFSPDLPAQNLAHDRGDVVAVEVPVGAQLERAVEEAILRQRDRRKLGDVAIVNTGDALFRRVRFRKHYPPVQPAARWPRSSETTASDAVC
jgi:hypothetical protein